jgi:hypothetical protein
MAASPVEQPLDELRPDQVPGPPVRRRRGSAGADALPPVAAAVTAAAASPREDVAEQLDQLGPPAGPSWSLTRVGGGAYERWGPFYTALTRADIVGHGPGVYEATAYELRSDGRRVRLGTGQTVVTREDCEQARPPAPAATPVAPGTAGEFTQYLLRQVEDLRLELRQRQAPGAGHGGGFSASGSPLVPAESVAEAERAARERIAAAERAADDRVQTLRATYEERRSAQETLHRTELGLLQGRLDDLTARLQRSEQRGSRLDDELEAERAKRREAEERELRSKADAGVLATLERLGEKAGPDSPLDRGLKMLGYAREAAGTGAGEADWLDQAEKLLTVGKRVLSEGPGLLDGLTSRGQAASGQRQVPPGVAALLARLESAVKGGEDPAAVLADVRQAVPAEVLALAASQPWERFRGDLYAYCAPASPLRTPEGSAWLGRLHAALIAGTGAQR